MLCAGILVADLVIPPLPELPAPGELTASEDFLLAPGGCAANVAISLAKLGIWSAVSGRVGADFFGEFLQNELHAFGVDTSGLRRSADRGTSKTVVLPVAGQDRRFVHSFGANADFTIEDVDRVPEALSAVECARQHPGCSEARRRVRRRVHRCLQMLGPAGKPRTRLRHSELQEELRPVVRRWRLCKYPAQEDSCRLGRTVALRRPGGLEQPRDDPVVGCRLSEQQVLGDSLVRVRLLGEELRCTTVTFRTLCACELRVDTASDDRVDERQRPARFEDPRCRQQFGCLGRLGRFEPCELRRWEKIALLEDRQRPS